MSSLTYALDHKPPKPTNHRAFLRKAISFTILACVGLLSLACDVTTQYRYLLFLALSFMVVSSFEGRSVGASWSDHWFHMGTKLAVILQDVGQNHAECNEVMVGTVL